MFDNNLAVVGLFQNGHQPDGGEPSPYFQFHESPMHATQYARKSPEKKQNLEPLEVKVTVEHPDLNNCLGTTTC